MASELEVKKSLDIAETSDGETNVPNPAKCRLVRIRTDLVVMPLITISMTLAFLDKVSQYFYATSHLLSDEPTLTARKQNALAYAAVYGLKDDTNLKNQEYSWLGSIFYFGYLFMEFPNLWIIYRLPAGRYMGACLMAWGVSLGLLAACHNFAGLAVIRFLLGAFEASILPCLILVNSTWYRREEQPLRTAFWANTFAGVFGGILSYAIGRIDGNLPTWKVKTSSYYLYTWRFSVVKAKAMQYIFIIYGAFTLLVGALVFFTLPESPSKAWFLNEDLKSVAILRLASNQTATQASSVSLMKTLAEVHLFSSPSTS